MGQTFYLPSVPAYKFFPIIALLLACQGPWDYYPENPENYQGIWASAFVVSERPIENVCFDKLHKLDELRLPSFAFYDSASIKITGKFSNAGTDEEISISLYPDTADFNQNPNCFLGASNALAKAGERYSIKAYFKWDSAGKTVESNLSAETYIPQKFKVKKIYDLLGAPHAQGDTLTYMPPPFDMKSHYFVPEYSDDVGAALVSMIYGTDVFWGENTIDKIAGQFSTDGDTARHAVFGDREQVYVAQNLQISNMKKDIDSIPIIAMQTPALGKAAFLFYATTRDYTDYYADKPISNITDGAGIFAGMLVDTVVVYFKPLDGIKIYSYDDAQKAWCMQYEEIKEDGIETCFDYWKNRKLDESIILDISNKNVNDLVTFCEHRNFPIKKYPLCGTALVHYSKSASGHSAILDREVKKWCEEHPTDSECGEL
ncbi:hypothetical protein AGMMS49938_11520 [Fibrobacterales bacterium]|nr:hypothetical protein AGMMS49938_11520 [Fibrobacterales bacterium]